MKNTTDEQKLTDFTQEELQIAKALGYENKLPDDKDLFEGGCLCHAYAKDSARACGNHAKILFDIRNVLALITKEKNALLDRLLEQAETMDRRLSFGERETTRAVPVEATKAERKL